MPLSDDWENLLAATQLTQSEKNFLREHPELTEGISPFGPTAITFIETRVKSAMGTLGETMTPDDVIDFLATVGTAGAALLAVKDLALGDPKSYLAVAGAVTFSQFIMEESLQAASFPFQQLVQNKLYERAAVQLDIAEEILKELEILNSTFGLLNPMTVKAFNLYAKATRAQIDANRLILGLKSGGVTGTAPTAQRDKALVRVFSSPSRSAIFIDGEDVGKLTAEEFSLKPGQYKIEIRRKGFPDFVTVLDLKGGDALAVKHDFEFGTSSIDPIDFSRPVEEEQEVIPPSEIPTEAPQPQPAPTPVSNDPFFGTISANLSANQRIEVINKMPIGEDLKIEIMFTAINLWLNVRNLLPTGGMTISKEDAGRNTARGLTFPWSETQDLGNAWQLDGADMQRLIDSIDAFLDELRTRLF